jgi:hypothetical protein
MMVSYANANLLGSHLDHVDVSGLDRVRQRRLAIGPDPVDIQ